MPDVPGPPVEPTSGGPSFALVAIGIEAALLLTVLPVATLLGCPPLETLRWDEPLSYLLGLATALPMVLAFGLLLYLPLRPLEALRRLSREVIAPLLRTCTTVELVLLAVLAGLAEEVAFRGFLQPYLAGAAAPWVGLLLASLIFGLLHALNLAYFLLATLAGLYLGLVSLATGNLIVPIVAHAVYDLVAVLVLARCAPPPATS